MGGGGGGGGCAVAINAGDLSYAQPFTHHTSTVCKCSYAREGGDVIFLDMTVISTVQTLFSPTHPFVLTAPSIRGGCYCYLPMVYARCLNLLV